MPATYVNAAAVKTLLAPSISDDDSKYKKRKTESTVAYKKMIDSGYTEINGVLRKEEGLD